MSCVWSLFMVYSKPVLSGHSTYFTEGRTDLPREAIGPDCFWRGSVPLFRRKHVVTCDFTGEGDPDPRRPSGSANVDAFSKYTVESRTVLFLFAWLLGKTVICVCEISGHIHIPYHIWIR